MLQALVSSLRPASRALGTAMPALALRGLTAAAPQPLADEADGGRGWLGQHGPARQEWSGCQWMRVDASHHVGRTPTSASHARCTRGRPMCQPNFLRLDVHALKLAAVLRCCCRTCLVQSARRGRSAPTRRGCHREEGHLSTGSAAVPRHAGRKWVSYGLIKGEES
jgi:hypothetical protein